MSYTRYLESGYYIYPCDNCVAFESGRIKVSDEELNVFLYELYKNHKTEFKQRIKSGKQTIERMQVNRFEL